MELSRTQKKLPFFKRLVHVFRSLGARRTIIRGFKVIVGKRSAQQPKFIEAPVRVVAFVPNPSIPLYENARRNGIEAICLPWEPQNRKVIDAFVEAKASFCLIFPAGSEVGDANKLFQAPSYFRAAGRPLVLVEGSSASLKAQLDPNAFILSSQAGSGEDEVFELPSNHPLVAQARQEGHEEYVYIAALGIDSIPVTPVFETVMAEEDDLDYVLSLFKTWFQAACLRAVKKEPDRRIVFVSSAQKWDMHRSHPFLEISGVLRTTAEFLQTEPEVEVKVTPKNPVFVHQIGKVGSTSIAHALEAARVGDFVFHTHDLSIRTQEEKERTFLSPDGLAGLKHYEAIREARANLDACTPASDIRVVTAVRDPIARVVSAFFQNIEEVIPEYETRANQGTLDAEMLEDFFFDLYNHDRLCDWFDARFEPVFGVKVTDIPFDLTQGHATYQKGNKKILVLKYERYGTDLNPALQEFFGKPNLSVPRRNESSKKAYAKVLEDFRRTPLPADYVERMLDCPVVRHFYTKEEIEQMRVKHTT